MDSSVKYGPAENPALKVRLVQRQWVRATHVELGLHLPANKKAVAATPARLPSHTLPRPAKRTSLHLHKHWDSDVESAPKVKCVGFIFSL